MSTTTADSASSTGQLATLFRPLLTRVSTASIIQGVATVDDVREFALGLERSYEVFVRGRRKFRIGSIVFIAFSSDETIIGFGFPKEEREALVASAPETFLMPEDSDLRFNWVRARLAALDPAEARELVLDAWRMCVPKSCPPPMTPADGSAPGGAGRSRGTTVIGSYHR